MNLPKTIMFYDGGCPLCSREIKHYRRLDSAGRIDWIDISRDASLLQAMGITLETAMARLHCPASGWMAGNRRLWLRRGLVGTPLLPLAGPSGVWPGPATAAGAPIQPIRPLAIPTPLSGGRLRLAGGGD
jgi:hypothetical protein